MDINSTHRGNDLNTPSNRPPISHSRLPLSWNFFHTLQFGKVSPIAPVELVKGDKYRLNLSHDITTMSLKSPLLSSLAIHRDFVSVPLEAILPLNSDKVVVQPNIGDDVPRDVNCVVEDFPSLIGDYVTACLRSVSFPDPSDYDFGDDIEAGNYIRSWCLGFSNLMRALVISEYFYSNGSLLSYCGYKLSKCFHYKEKTYKSVSFDKMFDSICRSLAKVENLDLGISLGSDPGVELSNRFIGNLRLSSFYNGDNYIGFVRFLEILRESPTTLLVNPVFQFDDEVYDNYAVASILSRANMFEDWNFDQIVDDVIDIKRPSVPLNFGRLAAYQLSYFQFFTNDRVDNIFDANLYRELVGYFVTQELGGRPKFAYNGISYNYDWLSGRCLRDCIELCLTEDNPLDRFVCLYLSYIFSYRNSLRYSDYFTGSKTRPLAVGDTSIQVTGQAVDVVDVTRKIQAQKFLNAVNRVGRKFSDYMIGIFGGSVPSYDYHYPMHIAGTSDYIRNNEVQNTGSDQLTEANSRTSMFNDSASKYILEFTADRNCIILGLEWFDIRRAYVNATEKQLFHVDRFDMFNPYFQFVGDQAIALAEYDMSRASALSDNFAYTTRYMEYKQKFDSAVGGFVENLPSWSFLADDTALTHVVDHLDPDFIRSSSTELDKFYVSLGGYSLGSYFHFVVSSMINYDGVRPMVVSPDIL